MGMYRIIIFLCLALCCCSKKESVQQSQKMCLSLSSEPTSLDPRKARDLNSAVILRMLFEGLMRTAKDGTLENAMAQSVDISEDGLTYVFRLRDAKWSNGEAVAASDFVSSWKTILDPQFPTDVAYHLYSIKNARNAKLNQASLDDVGLKVVDPLTFSVELEASTPYFLELLTMAPFFPTPLSVIQKNPHWSSEADAFVSNGPFCIKNWNHTDQITLVKNPQYWQEGLVQLDQVDLVVSSPDTALKMFEEGKIDWTGSPLASIPSDAVKSLKEEKKLESSPFLATSFVRLNVSEMIGTKTNPLASVFLRRSLAYALDRQAIVEHILQAGQTVATRLVPSSMGLNSFGYFQDHNVALAQKCLEQYVQDHSSLVEPLVISYYNNERNATLALALQKQWQEELKIPVLLEVVELKTYFQRVSRKEYQIAIGSWTADFNDPINFLEVFKYKDNGTNNTCWESNQYIDLLNRSTVCKDKEERREILRQAENLLMEEMPLIPIYHLSVNYVKNDALKDVIVSSEGHLDLRYAHWDSVR